MGPRSPTVKVDVNVNRTELTMRLLRTTRMKRARDGMHANREVCAGRVFSLHDTVRFLGVLVGILKLPNLKNKVTAKQSL